MKIERKTLNDVPGVACPFCGEGTLAFESLDQFLQAVQHGFGPRCRTCGESVVMDASRAGACVGQLKAVKQNTDEALKLADQAA